MLTQCERCPAIWSPGSEEWEDQQCGACGWRPGNIGDVDEDYDFDDTDDFDHSDDDDVDDEWRALDDDEDDDDDDIIPYEPIS